VPPYIISLNVPNLFEFSLPEVPKCVTPADLFFEYGYLPIDDLVS
jgi:hypothetical protein